MQGERDAQAKEKAEAQKSVEQLKQQVSAKASELQKERHEKAAGAQRMMALETELAGVKDERDAQAKEAREAREEAELTLLQLHQVQEELEAVFLADQVKQKKLEEMNQQVSAKASQLETERKERALAAEQVIALEADLTRMQGERDAQAKENGKAQKSVEQLEQQISVKGAELEEEIKAKAAGTERIKALEEELARAKGERDAQVKEKAEARAEAELTLLQLHQVQEELENYYIKSRGADQLAAAQQDQLARAQRVMAKLLPEASRLTFAQKVAVEVLPPSPPEDEVQTQALLNSYANSLRRAAALLQRAIRS